MNRMWKVLVGIGVLMMFSAFSMDTTVSFGGQRIHNLGRQADQQMLLMLGCALFLGGMVLFAVIKIKQTPEQEEKIKAEQQETTARNVAAVNSQFSQAWIDIVEIAQIIRPALKKKWGKVRRVYVLLIGAVFVGCTVAFPPYLITDFSGLGLKVEFVQRLMIGSKGELLMDQLIKEVLVELVIIGLICWKARN